MDKIYTYEKKKGFTLVELLAVITVLAVLLLIATPAVLNVIPGAKRTLFIYQLERDLQAFSAEQVFNENEIGYDYDVICYYHLLAEFGSTIGEKYDGYFIYYPEKNRITITLSNGEYMVNNYEYEGSGKLDDVVEVYSESVWEEYNDFNAHCKADSSCQICENRMEPYFGFYGPRAFSNMEKNLLTDGPTINYMMKALAGGAENIKEIKYSETVNESGAYIGYAPIDENNGPKSYIWYDSGIIYYGSTEPNQEIYITDGSYLFYDLPNVEKIDASHLDNSINVSLYYMFKNCVNLKELNISNWNTSYVRFAESVFDNCKSLTEIDVSKWDTRNFVVINYIFAGCENIKTVDVTRWNTSNVIEMHGVFGGCAKLKYVDVSLWDTSNVTTMESVFQNCYDLEELDVSGWDTSNVTEMQRMFCGADDIRNLDVSHFNTSKVTNFELMFNGMNYSDIDTSNFDLSSAENVKQMCSNLRVNTKLVFKPIKNTKLTNSANFKYMVNNCTLLEVLDLSFFTKGISSNTVRNCPKLTTVYVNKSYPDPLTIKFTGCSKVNTLTRREDF